MKNFEAHRLICMSAVIMLFITVASLLLNGSLTIYFAIASLILFVVESYRDKTEKRKGALDFISFVLIIIIIYKIII